MARTVHANPDGTPRGCNAWCEPEKGIHTNVVWRNRRARLRPGARGASNTWGPVTVLAEAHASREAPPAPDQATGSAVAIVSTVRYDRPPPWYRERPPRAGEQPGHVGDELPLVDLTEARR